MQLRLFRILWGPTLETVLDFVTPVAGDSPRIWRKPRAESERLDAGAASDALITGRDYYLSVVAKWFDLAHQTGATGLQAFIDWANDGNAFTLVPSTDTPTLTVPGCFLEAPIIDPAWSAENDATMTVELVIRHPTQDLGLAWRGLFFEYVAGQSLTDPVAYTATRASIGYEITPQGYLLSHPVDSVCDGHYPDRVGGLQTTLLEPAVANDITNPEALDNASWDKTTNVTVTPNNAKAPDQNITADLVVETVTNGVHCIASNAIVIVSGDVQTALVFLRDGGRYKGAIYFGNGVGSAPANRFGVSYDLSLGTISPNNLGAGTLAGSLIVPLAGGWFMIWIRGAINGGELSSRLNLRMFDNAGTGSYAGDAASGTYYWGATAVHGVNNFVASYTPTTAALDLLAAPTPAGLVPQALWIYVKGIEAGAILAAAGQFPAPITLGDFGAAPHWRTIIDVNNGTANRYAINNGDSGTSVTQSTASAPAVGQLFELLGLVFADGSVKIIQAIAGGVEVASAQSGAPSHAAPAVYSGSPNRILIGDAGNYGSDVHQLAQIKIGPGGAVNTIAAARDV